jgi:hypothetical protein
MFRKGWDVQGDDLVGGVPIRKTTYVTCTGGVIGWYYVDFDHAQNSPPRGGGGKRGRGGFARSRFCLCRSKKDTKLSLYTKTFYSAIS